MPKVKTHSGAKKRFKKTASGKFKFAHTFKRHLLTGRSKKMKLVVGSRQGSASATAIELLRGRSKPSGR